MNNPMPRTSVVLFLALLFVMPSVALAATDSITVATVTASSSTVEVPISIRDLAGTPLGLDQPATSRIQSFAFKVTYSPASAVQSVTVGRAGITQNLDPVFESKPATSGSISLLETFQQSTNPVPFTLNAVAPGNLVARMTFTLSPSAAPGTSISLTIDPTVSVLSDEGGTSATKETVSNGRLSLVNGAINLPALSVSLSPSSKNINLGSLSTFFAILNVAPVSSTVVNLSSSDASIAKVPATVTIPAGVTQTGFTVTAVALGTATITATLANSSNDTARITVVPAPDVCNTPATSQLTAPSNADAGAAYTVSWAEVTNASEYVLEESTDATFATATTTQTLTATSATFTHNAGNTRYYYRLRAHNKNGSCDVFSGYSEVVNVLINPVPVPLKRILAVVGSVQGGFGSNFKTSVQLYNPKDVTVSGKIVFHPANAAGGANDPSMNYSLAPGKTQSYGDLLPAMGIPSGLGSADIIGDIDSPLPVSLVRVFNDAGVSGTTGLAEDALVEEDALQPGSTGVLIAPDDVTKFRLNIGLRTLSSGAALTITVRNEGGVIVKTVTKTFDPTFFTQQTSPQLLDGYALAGGETISFAVTSGSVFIYGSTTDNTTNDPSVQFAKAIQ